MSKANSKHNLFYCKANCFLCWKI